jgi:hypothetical protein
LFSEVNIEEEFFSYKKYYFNKIDVSVLMGIPVVSLSFLSLLIGYIF